MEQELLQMLQQTPGVVYSFREVGRRVDREKYRENPGWARPYLESLLHQHLVQLDENGHYFCPKPRSKSSKLGEIT
jgi:hypothetical protein